MVARRQPRGDDGLTGQEREFVRLIGEGSEQVNAYREAFQSRGSVKTCTSYAWKVMHRPAVRTALDAFRAEVAGRLTEVAKRQAISRETISLELASIAFCRGELKKEDGWDDRIVPVSQVRRALMDLATLHGYIVERKDVRIIRSVEDLTDEELAALAADREQGYGTRH